MKENKVYYNYKGVYCQRLIRALEAKPLTLNQIMTELRRQTKHDNNLYNRHPSKGKVKQILAKYPIFRNIGITEGLSSTGHRMPVSMYMLDLGE